MRTTVPDELVDVLQFMLDELMNNRLDVVKAPSSKNGYVRVVNSHNTTWYREFCAQHLSSGRGSKAGQWHKVVSRDKKSQKTVKARNWNRRQHRKKLDTVIKRKDTVRLLKYMIDKKTTVSRYAGSLLDIARTIDEQWKEEESLVAEQYLEEMSSEEDFLSEDLDEVPF